MADGIDVTPMDKYNRELVENVHPPGWTNPEPAPRYNLVVIGAGSAGLVTAAGAAGLGAKVALVERHLLGGDCLNVGCVPSKCLIRCARAAADVAAAGSLGINVPEGVTVDFASVMERMRKLRSRISAHDSARRFQELGVDVFLGSGRFSGTHSVEVGGKTLRFSKAVIATGARAVVPQVEGLADVGYLTNENVFNLTELPRRLAVFGAGPIGCELAQAFHRLGSEVTLIQRSGQFLKREDADAAAIVTSAFEMEGIKVMLNTKVDRVKRGDDGIVLHLVKDGRELTLVADKVLIGAGRAPNVEGLNLEVAGVDYDIRRGVIVNDRLQTSNSRIYAAGDICLEHKFTHTADATARIVIQNALFWGRKKLSALTIPWCTYTDPEIARVGVNERMADERGIAIDTFTRHFNDVDRAIVDGEEDGLVKIHVLKGTDEILGATIVARHAGDMINEITLAIVAEVGLGKIAGVIHPYPTQAEAIKHVADAYNRTRLTGAMKKLFNKILAWRR